jgi:ATP-dependent DNA helicase DinG
VRDLLATAVGAIGGAERPGQVTMAEAVADAIETGTHVAVQAGTGTGKSLAYLVPALRHAIATGNTVVVATATIALQRQLIDRDLPRLAEALAPQLGTEPKFAILKGRRNYLCLNRQRGGVADDSPFSDPAFSDTLFDPTDTLSPLGRQVKRLHEWAEDTETGDRDELVPGVPDAAWRQVSVSAQECVGAARCAYGQRCFAEKARETAGLAHVVVTNHALLAIDATSEIDVLPEHDVVIVDEAHDLVDRVTSAVAGEVSGSALDVAGRRAARLADTKDDKSTAAEKLREAGNALTIDLEDVPPGRLDVLPGTLAATLASIREAAGSCAEQVRAVGKRTEDDPQQQSAIRMTVAALDELGATAARILDTFELPITARDDVVWLDKPLTDDSRRPPALRIAPLEVGGLLRERLFRPRTVALTSATLVLGGSFTPLAIQWGLPASGAVAGTPSVAPGPGGSGSRVAGGSASGGPGSEPASPAEEIVWRGIDAGSPFDHARSGILYVAKHLPSPGRDGLPEQYLTELAELIDAAGGRTLGLFSSMRAAVQAADALLDRIS